MSSDSNDKVVLERILEAWSEGLDDEYSASDIMELFCADQILKDHSLSYEEVESGIVDGSGDGGIDSIFTLVNGRLVDDAASLPDFSKSAVIDVYCIQTKTNTGFSENSIKVLDKNLSKLTSLSIYSAKLSPEFSDAVIEKFQLFKDVFLKLTPTFPELNFHIYFCTKGETSKISANARKASDDLLETLKKDFSDASAKFNFLGARELVDLSREKPSLVFELALSENPVSSSTSGGYVAFCRIADYKAFITDDDGNLFTAILDENVRDYQGDVTVNRAIRETLEQKTEVDFWWLNNGITILCTRANVSGRIMNIEEPYVVNGLQTSNEIFRYAREKDVGDDNRNILIRIIPSESEEDRDQIIRATNSQTYIPPTQLRATERIHRDIENVLRANGLYYERRKNYYKNRGEKRDKIVSISLLAQSIMAALLGRPDDARARPATLLNNEAHYEQIFNENFEIQFYSKVAVAERAVDVFLKSRDELSPRDRNNLRFYVLALAVRDILDPTQPHPAAIADLDVGELKSKFFGPAFRKAKSAYNRLGGTDQVAKGNDMPADLGFK